jgi:DNA-binding HxlR family transcriptional regulator
LRLTKRISKKLRPYADSAAISKEADKEKRGILKAGKIKVANVLFKFALLRFDELGELALHLRSRLAGNSVVTKKMLAESLREMKDGKWRNLGEYARYLSDPEYERRDFTKNSAWLIVNSEELGSSPPAVVQKRRGDAKQILVSPINDPVKLEVSGYLVKPAGPGKVRLIKQ